MPRRARRSSRSSTSDAREPYMRNGVATTAATADHDRRVGTLDRSGQRRCVAYVVMRSLVGDVRFGPEAFDEADRLLHAVDARLRRVVRDTQLLVIARLPAGADAELEPPAGQK